MLCLLGIAMVMTTMGISGAVSWIAVLIALGVGAITFALMDSVMAAALATASSVIVTMVALRFAHIDGFRGAPSEISGLVQKMKSKQEGFTDVSPDDIAKLMKVMKELKNEKQEGFMNVTRNILQAGYGTPGFGIGAPLVEGYEDVKKEKDEKPAPASKEEKKKGKKEMPAPFTLGEIPSQAKNGPHIDAGSTLIKAIKGLNPDQISAMTKDTKQLIDTQKSLMGMLGTMKPMLNDGKQLMETFQEMFGNE